MAVIDDKVVAMSFESSKFESGVNKTISSLDKLKASLHFPNAGKGLQDIDAAAKRVDLGHISRGIDGVKKALESLRLIAIGVMAQLATQAVRAGAKFVSAFTLDPLKAGFAEYSTNLNAVQTILANTQAAGVGLKEVNATLKELNEYSDKTIYNFGQMARNIGTFTAAGVELKTATASIKGIANLAALSGSSAEQAATAMYQLSQGIAAGSIKLQDWNSVVNAGMGGTVFQRALAQTAEQVGTLKEGTVKLVGPMKNVTIAGEAFRQSLSTPGKASWLTSEVLTKTLKQFTGDLTDAELAAQGFNAAQIKAIQQTAKTAMFAATEVKTISQVFDVAKETAASGWAATFQIIFGTFTEAKKTFTEMSNAINGFINASADARNKVLADWKALGGRTVLINSIKTAFHNLGLILKPIKEAFRDIFPAATGKDLYNLTLQFQNFAKALKPSEQTVENLKRTFRGLFAIFSIAKQIVGGVLSVFSQLFGSIGDGSGSFLNFTGNIGDFLVSIDAALKKGNRLTNFFDDIADVLQAPIDLLKALATALSDLFSGFSPGGFSEEVDGMTKALTPFQKIMEGVSTVWGNFLDSISNSGNVMKPALDAFVDLISGIGTAIGQATSGMNFEAILAVIRTGLLGGLVLMFKQFLGKGSLMAQLGGAGGGILGNISKSFDALSGSMQAMQTNIKADTLKKIAIAIALLTASVVALSFVDPERLKSSLTAMTVAFGQLLGAMVILGNISKSMGFIKMPVIAASMILLAGAITILSAAVVILAQLSWGELARGLGGVAVLLGVVSAAVIPLSANSAGMIRAGIGITAIAIALNLLALAVRQFASMSLTELGKGLGSVAVGLGIMIAAMKKMPVSGMIAAGVGMSAIAIALNLLALAVRQFASMSLQALGKGLGAIAISLGTIVLAMKLMPKGMVKQAAALILIAGALNLIAQAVKTMGGMSVEQIAKGLGALAGALIILAGALYLMSGTLAGAAALGVAAAGIALLVPALTSLGKMSWGSIIKGLVALGAAFVVIGAAGYLLTAAVPGLLGFGAAIVLIGAGLALAGAGIFLIATGLSAIAVAGPTALGILGTAMAQFAEAMIENAKLIVLGVLEIVEAFAATAPKFAAALVKIIASLLDAIIQSAPKIGEAFTALLDTALGILAQNQDKLIQAGFDLIVALLQGIKNNIPQIVVLVTDIIATFLRSIANNLGKIITAGGQVLISLLKGIANNLTMIVGAVGNIIVKFVGAVASNLGKIATAGLSLLVKFLKAISDNLGQVIKAGTDIVVKFITGIGNAGARIVTAAVQAIIKFINAVAQQTPKLVDAGFKAIIAFLNGIADAIDQNSEAMGQAGARIGVAIVKGLANAIRAGVGDIASALLSLLPGPLKKFAGKLGLASPSKVFYKFGEYIVDGLALGIKKTDSASKALETTANDLITMFNDIFETASPSKVMYKIGQFVVQGFADGLRGSADDVRNAFAAMKQRLKDDIVGVREDIASEQDRLAEMLESKQEKLDAINDKKWKKAGEKAKAIAEVQNEYAKSIKESEDAIKSSEATLLKLTATQKILNKSLQDEKVNLIKLANEFEKVNAKLKKAQDELKAIVKERDDFARSQTDKYAAAPEISEPLTEEIKSAKTAIAKQETELTDLLKEQETERNKIKNKEVKSEKDKQNQLEDLSELEIKHAEEVTNAKAAIVTEQENLNKLVEGKVLTGDGSSVDVVATYLQDLAAQEKAVAAYGQTLEALRGMRLDEKTYRMLVEEGVAAQGFAEALLAGGKTAVNSVNKLDTDIATEADKLAVSSAAYLYDAGIKTAEGFVKGFERDRDKLLKKVSNLGKDIIKQFKKALGIKSPSEEFAEIGKFSMEGLAKGFSDSSKLVEDAVDDAAKGALSTMQRSMRGISDVVMNDLNPNPVITPILDLTQVRAQAGELSALTKVVPITAAASYNQASLISAANRTIAQMDENAAASAGTSVKFEQNNYSPEALTEIEIYRQTKNQLSQLKSVLAIT